MVGLKTAYFVCFRHGCLILYETAYFVYFCIGAGGLEIAKPREMAWGRYSIPIPKHSAMPGVFHKEIARKNFLKKKNPDIQQYRNFLVKEIFGTEIFW